MLELTRTLCGLSGVSSREEDVRSYLANALRHLVSLCLKLDADVPAELYLYKTGYWKKYAAAIRAAV